MATQQEIEDSREATGYRYFHVHPAVYGGMWIDLNVANGFPKPAGNDARGKPVGRTMELLRPFGLMEKDSATPPWALVTLKERFATPAAVAIFDAIAANRLEELTKAEIDAISP